MGTNLVNGNTEVGVAVGTATSTSVRIGYQPRAVKVFNETTNMQYELVNGFKVKSSASDSLLYQAIR